MDFDIEPMGNTVVNVPDDTAEYENETFIRFIFTAKDDTDYCENGYEVCFDQLRIAEGKACKAAEVKGNVEAVETPLDITVTVGDVVYRFDKRKSAFISVKFGGRELLDRPLQYNFFRAPTDNEDRKSTRLNSSHIQKSRMPSSA